MVEIRTMYAKKNIICVKKPIVIVEKKEVAEN